jgi:transcription-repair coupling factor (superfamily II helicase)
MADLQTIAEVEAIFEEFTDRFGIPPEPVMNLLFQLKVRILAEGSDVTSVNVENGQIAIRFRSGSPPDGLKETNHRFRLGKTTLWLPNLAVPNWKDSLVETLELLSNYKTDDQNE